MKPIPILTSLFFAAALPLSAQEFSELWLLGIENGNQSEFSQEGGNNGAPGAADAQDDDFYFAGTYDDPIGTVAADEPFANYDRALTPGDPFNRIHFHLDAVGADPGTQLRLSMQLGQLGAPEGSESIHDVVIRFNGTEIFEQTDIDAELLVEETVIARDVNAVEGANVIEIERTGKPASGWIQFDYVRLEAGPSDLDGDGMPDKFEEQYAFLNSEDAADAALDEDQDGLTNLEEYQVASNPSEADTDGDTLNDADEVRVHQTRPDLADSDGDSLDDAAEINVHESDPNVVDTDGDSLRDGDEVNVHQTDPTVADSDTDGVDDATEVELGTDPNDPTDIPVLYTPLWLLGLQNGNQSEFSQESGASPAPGSAMEQDDDYYFAGTYPGEIGTVAADEALANYDRALTAGDPTNRIHFNLDDISASEGAEYRVEVQLCCLGPADGSTHDIVMRLNDFEFFSQNGITGDTLVRATVSGSDAGAAPGPNTLTIERLDGTGWIQFDYLAMEYRTDDTDRDRLPNSYEANYDFLDPADPADAALDQDDDGLTNLEEFENKTEPANPDTDNDGLADGAEVKEYGSKPRVADTDGDGLLDGDEVTKHNTLVLDQDTDDDGLIDGREITAGSDPLQVDTDGDGESDNDEVLYGTSPIDPNSLPVPYEQLWQIGEADDSQAEFSQEAGGNQPGPGSAEALDDDYYLAGTYPDPIGVVAVDEDWTNFERAITSGDPFNRIHFNLTDDLVQETIQMRLHVELGQIGSGGDESIHDVVIRVNGHDIYSLTDIEEDVNIDASFLPTEVDAVVGANVIEIERTGQTASSWIQFDVISLDQRMILTDDPNLLIQTRNVFGELSSVSPQTRTLEITNTGSENALNITSATITGLDSAHYAVSEPPATLAPREEGSITVTFDPQGRAGGFSAFLELASNDSGEEVVRVDLSAIIDSGSGLVAHYPFDETEGNTASDISGRGRHAEFQTTGDGAFLLGQEPLAAGQSVSLGSDGTGAAYGEVVDTFDPFVDTSISLWFQAESSPNVLTLLSKNQSADSQGDPFALAYADGSVFVFAGGEAVLSAEAAPGEAHHLAVAFDNSSDDRAVIIYLNGEEMDRIEGISGFDDLGNAPLQIGALSGGFGFQGRIDDLQIYDKVLAEEDVQFLQGNPGQALAGDTIPVDPNVDSDGDGQSDSVEQLAGTDPNDATSFFQLEPPTRGDAGIDIGWSSVDGTTYVLEFSPTLNDDWQEVTTITATGATSNYMDADANRTAAAAGYYRLRIQQ